MSQSIGSATEAGLTLQASSYDDSTHTQVPEDYETVLPASVAGQENPRCHRSDSSPSLSDSSSLVQDTTSNPGNGDLVDSSSTNSYPLANNLEESSSHSKPNTHLSHVISSHSRPNAHLSHGIYQDAERDRTLPKPLTPHDQLLRCKLTISLLYFDLKRVMRPTRLRNLESAIEDYCHQMDQMSHEEVKERAHELCCWSQTIQVASNTVKATEQALSLLECNIPRLQARGTRQHPGVSKRASKRVNQRPRTLQDVQLSGVTPRLETIASQHAKDSTVSAAVRIPEGNNTPQWDDTLMSAQSSDFFFENDE